MASRLTSVTHATSRGACDTIGGFLQTDPIRFDAGDVNLYRYVSNSPANWGDPMGLEWVEQDLNVGSWQFTGFELNVEGGAPSAGGAGLVLDSSNNIIMHFSATATVVCVCTKSGRTVEASGTRVAERRGHLTSLPDVLFVSGARVANVAGLVRSAAQKSADEARKLDSWQFGEQLTQQRGDAKPKGGEAGGGWKDGASPCSRL